MKTVCYVFNPKMGGNILPIDKLPVSNTIYYPEKTMSLHQQCTSGRPAEFNIVTDSPFLVGLYDREEVYVYNSERSRWEHPNIQTYGASFDVIISQVFGYQQGIAGAVISNRFVTNVMGHPVGKQLTPTNDNV